MATLNQGDAQPSVNLVHKIHLDTMGRKPFCVVNLVFALYLLATFIAAFYTPTPFIFFDGGSISCSTLNANQADTIPLSPCKLILPGEASDSLIWMGRIDNLSHRHQVLIVYQYYSKNGLVDEENHSLTYTTKISLRAKNSNDEHFQYILNGEKTYQQEVGCLSESFKLCSREVLLTVPFLHFNTYDVAVEMFGFPQEPQDYNGAVYFGFATVNPDFTDMQMGAKVGFSVISLIFAMAYTVQYCRLKKHQLQPEQKLLLPLTWMAVMFNDPLFPLSIQKPSFLSYIVLSIFQAQFLVMLLYFILFYNWRVTRQDMQRDDKFFGWFKFFFFFVFFVILVVVFVMAVLYVDADPGTTLSTMNSELTYALFGLGIFYLVVYCFWNLAYICRGCVRIKGLPFRHKYGFFLVLLGLFLVAVAVGIGAFVPFDYSGSEYLFLKAFITGLIGILALLYTPAKGSLNETGEIEMAYDPLESVNLNDSEIEFDQQARGGPSEEFKEESKTNNFI